MHYHFLHLRGDKMKKNSKRIGQDYSKYEDRPDCLAYYGILMKDGRSRVDTKRFRKFFELPDNKIEHRKSVYYIPTKKHRNEYICNRFYDGLESLKRLWHNEFSNAIKIIKTPEQVEDDSRIANLMDGVLEYDEACMVAKISAFKRENEYRYVKKSLYAQFFQQVMSQIDALCIRVIKDKGYQEKNFSKPQFDIFIQGKQQKDSKSFREFEFYHIYDRAYSVWNFLKHNSTKAYQQLKAKYPEMIYDPSNKYQNGDIAISVLKLDEKYILKTLEELPKFFDELCLRAFGENAKDAKWDYDDYFIKTAQDAIDIIVNPLGLPDYL